MRSSLVGRLIHGSAIRPTHLFPELHIRPCLFVSLFSSILMSEMPSIAFDISPHHRRSASTLHWSVYFPPLSTFRGPFCAFVWRLLHAITENNNADCEYDQGDCCWCDCSDSDCPPMNDESYDCRNPFSECFDDDDAVDNDDAVDDDDGALQCSGEVVLSSACFVDE